VCVHRDAELGFLCSLLSAVKQFRNSGAEQGSRNCLANKSRTSPCDRQVSDLTD
jgi:hypothetical protein